MGEWVSTVVPPTPGAGARACSLLLILGKSWLLLEGLGRGLEAWWTWQWARKRGNGWGTFVPLDLWERK